MVWASAILRNANSCAFSTEKLDRIMVREQKISFLRNTELIQHNPNCNVAIMR
jgi:hypothetical protein